MGLRRVTFGHTYFMLNRLTFKGKIGDFILGLNMTI